MNADTLYTASTWIVPLLLAIPLHEAAHGYAALHFGDRTALERGRISMNPFRHVDPIGTVLVPGMLFLSGSGVLFGWAKPVPVDWRRLRKPRRDMIWVAAAGPAMNIALAALAILAWRLLAPIAPEEWSDWIFVTLSNTVILNLVLAVFNMLPIPPLDGGRVAVGLLPARLARPLARLERFGLFIILGLLLLPPLLGDLIGVELNLFRTVIGPVVYGLVDGMVWLLAGG